MFAASAGSACYNHFEARASKGFEGLCIRPMRPSARTMEVSKTLKPATRSIEHATPFDYGSHVLLCLVCSASAAFRIAIGPVFGNLRSELLHRPLL